MFCPKCGKQVEDGAAFCPGCGNPMPKVAVMPPQAPPTAPVDNSGTAPQQGAPTPSYTNEYARPYVSTTPKKKFPVAGIIGIAAGAVAIIVLIVCLATCGGSAKMYDSDNCITPAYVQSSSLKKLDAAMTKAGYDSDSYDNSYGSLQFTEYDYSLGDDSFQILVNAKGKIAGASFYTVLADQQAVNRYLKDDISTSKSTLYDEDSDGQPDCMLGICKLDGQKALIMVTIDSGDSVNTMILDYDSLMASGMIDSIESSGSTDSIDDVYQTMNSVLIDEGYTIIK